MQNYIGTVNNEDYCLYKDINSLGFFPGESAIELFTWNFFGEIY